MARRRRQLVAAAIEAAHEYARETWRIADGLLVSLGVRVIWGEGEDTIRTTHGVPPTPRAQRDPAPFVAATS